MSLEEMWQRLAQHQPIADRRGYGPAWARMCAERTEDAAEAAAAEAAEMAWAAADAEAAAAWADAEAVAVKAVEWIEKAELRDALREDALVCLSETHQQLNAQTTAVVVEGIQAAVLAEREACAELVEQGTGDWLLGKKIATAIRARGER